MILHICYLFCILAYLLGRCRKWFDQTGQITDYLWVETRYIDKYFTKKTSTWSKVNLKNVHIALCVATLELKITNP